MKPPEKEEAKFILRLPVELNEKVRIECKRLGMTKQGYVYKAVEQRIRSGK